MFLSQMVDMSVHLRSLFVNGVHDGNFIQRKQIIKKPNQQKQFKNIFFLNFSGCTLPDISFLLIIVVFYTQWRIVHAEM